MIRKVSSLDHNTGLYKAEFKLLDADKKVIDEGIESNGYWINTWSNILLR